MTDLDKFRGMNPPPIDLISKKIHELLRDHARFIEIVNSLSGLFSEYELLLEYLKENNIAHPHGYGDTSKFSNNTIYVGKKNLEINGKKVFNRGHGLFKKTHNDLILTEANKTRSRWKLPSKYFSNTEGLFLNRMKWENEKECTIFYKGFGQEFILDIEKNPNVMMQTASSGQRSLYRIFDNDSMSLWVAL